MSKNYTQPVDLKEQIERCHRLAEGLTDEDMRSALQKLASDYESQLSRHAMRGEGFMLQPSSDEDRA